jgi:hypothetical protein
MRKTSSLFLGLSLAAACITMAAAQPDQSPSAVKPPKYLQITVEYVKPGKGGLAHDKTESAYVQAMTRLKFPINYFAFNAMTGKQRAIYISGFDSYGEMGKANKVFEAPGVASAMEPLNVADGDLLEDSKTLIFSYDADLSLRPDADLLHMRFLEADILHVRSGKGKEFHELAKMWVDLGQKAGPSAHWACFHDEYGEDGGSYVCLTADNSLEDVDKSSADYEKVFGTASDDAKKRMRELRAEALDEDRSELYSVNPAQSYAPADFGKADPFWKPKGAAAAPKPAPKAPILDTKPPKQ